MEQLLHKREPVDRNDIAASLILEKIDADLFRSVNLWKPAPMARAVFGGQIIGQAMVAAHRTIDRQELAVHSMHAYFLLPGDPKLPAIYHVERIRDGKSFATRSVLVKQNARPIFSAQFSFHKGEYSPADVADPMPACPTPEESVPRIEYLRTLLQKAKPQLKPAFQASIDAFEKLPSPLELRYCDPEDSLLLSPLRREGKSGPVMLWFRSRMKLIDRPWAHDCVSAYASDHGLASAAARPMGSPYHQYSMVASLDHSMWFHSSFRADDWLLYVNSCSRFVSGRAMTNGRIYNRKGKLVVSVAQELIMRVKLPPGEIPDASSASRVKAKL
eukprot:gene2379-3687_t